MHHTEVAVLGMVFALDAPSAMIDTIVAAVRSRCHVTSATKPPAVTYEIRTKGDGYELVRITATECESVAVEQTGHDLGELIADDLHRSVAEDQDRLLLVHAGAVEWNGIGIVIPGRSRSGKSTLTAALIGAGARYLSDELAPIDSDGLVHPYPRQLSLRDETGVGRPTPAEDLGAATADRACPVRVMVDTCFVAGETFFPTVSSGAATLLRLIDNTIVARSRPEHTMRVVARLGDEVQTLTSPRGDADVAAAVILRFVDREFSTPVVDEAKGESYAGGPGSVSPVP
jgi:hypothetical protein